MSDGQQFEPPIEESPAAPVSSVWQMLRETREARGLTIAEVAQHLKLTPRQVEAMEAGDLAHLPGPAFARGFVRNYARFLHIDPAHFNHVLDAVREVPAPISNLPLGRMPGPARWRFSALPALGIAGGLLALAVAGWYYGWFEPRDEQYLADMMTQSAALAEPVSAPLASAPVAVPAQSEPSAPVVDITTASVPIAAVAVPPVASAPGAAASSSASSVAASAAAGSVVAIPATPAVPKAASAPLAQSAALVGPVPKGSHRLHFAFDADAWVEVRDANGKVVFSRLNPAGSEQDVQGEAPLQVVIGNAPQVRLSVDGKPLDLGSRTSSNVARLSLP